jgi:hypothetical protein
VYVVESRCQSYAQPISYRRMTCRRGLGQTETVTFLA